MTGTVRYDDRNLQQLFARMDTRQRLKVLKAAFRREAAQVRKVAVNNLRASIRTDRNLASGIRAVLFRRRAGFSVTIGSKQMKGRSKGTRQYGRARMTWTGFGYHTNRRGKDKPVLIWAEAGTKWRKSKTATKYPVDGRWASGKNRGFMKRYGFMQKTQEQVRDNVTRDLRNEVINSITKEAKKYGCT